MTIYQVSLKACVFVNPKAGSSSMADAIHKVPWTELTLEEAFRKKNDPKDPLIELVVFIRHPVDLLTGRTDSMFHMLYWMALNNADYIDFMPRGTITADGRRVAGFKGSNEHHHDTKKEADYDARVAAKRDGKEIPDADLTKELDNEDYRRYIDFLLEKDRDGDYRNLDDHWGVQVDLCTYNGEFLPNIAHRFDTEANINKHWVKYVGGTLPVTNFSQAIPHDEYRLDDLKTYYKKDIDLWGAIDGTWNPS